MVELSHLRRRPTASLSSYGDPQAIGSAGASDATTLLLRLEALHRDLLRVAAGTAPNAAELARAPMLSRWQISQRSTLCLEGIGTGHPSLPDGPILSSGLWALSRDRGWARTLSRWYCLGEPQEAEP